MGYAKEISREKSGKSETQGTFVLGLRNEEQGELGLAAFQQPGVASALVAAIADILLIDIAVAGLQFADKGAFRYPAGTQQPVFTHIVR